MSVSVEELPLTSGEVPLTKVAKEEGWTRGQAYKLAQRHDTLRLSDGHIGRVKRDPKGRIWVTIEESELVKDLRRQVHHLQDEIDRQNRIIDRLLG